MSIAAYQPVFHRVLLKLSGEAFIHKVCVGEGGDEPGFGIDAQVVSRLANEVLEVVSIGVQIAIVVGGGNFFRGRDLIPMGLDPITSDQMGMLSTIINALAFKDAIKKLNHECHVLSAFPVGNLVEHYCRDRAIALLKEGKIVILAGGTGNPLVTTDSAASLRGIEVKADVILKGTNVDGVYSKDPTKHSSAVLYDQLTFDQVIAQELGVMDLSAFHQCRRYKMPIRVFNIKKPGALLRIMLGEKEGTLVTI
jgi:uridylate kinase